MRKADLPLIAAGVATFVVVQAIVSAITSSFRPDPSGLLQPTPEERIKANPNTTPMRVRPSTDATTPPKGEPPKGEPPKAQPPKAEPPKAEPPKAEPPASTPAPASPAPPARPALGPLGPGYGSGSAPVERGPAYGPAISGPAARGPGDLAPSSPWQHSPGPSGPGDL